MLDAESISTFVPDDDGGNESVLRVSLLWDEHLKKAVESPTAVLGLIDIANSRDVVASTWEILEPAIANAVINVAESMDTKSAWNFLTTLLEKFEDEPFTGIISKALRFAGTKLTQRNWGSALTYLAGEVPIERGNSGELLQSVATSLATIDPNQLTGALAAVSPERLLKIVLLDDGLLARIFSATDTMIDAALIQSLTQGFQALTPEERSGQGLRFLPLIRGDQDSALLGSDHCGRSNYTQLVEAVDLVWGANALRTQQLGEILCDAAMANVSRLKVRSAFARLSDDDQTNRCIERLLTVDPADMRWLLENEEIGNRRTIFLNRFIEGSSPDELARAFSTAELAAKALNLLAGDLKQFASTASRIVMIPTIAAADHITLGLKIYQMLQGAERALLAQSVVSRVLTDAAAQGGDLPEHVMAVVHDDIDLPAVITIGLGTDQDGKQVSRVLVAFDRVAPAVRTLLEVHVDLIVRLVAARRDFDLTAEGAMAIARLIETAAQLDHRTYVKICSAILPFALSARQKPASPLIIVAFPTIYDGLRKGSGNLGLMKLFNFVDRDQRKIARKNLVRAFMTSQWPPADLAVTAFRAGELSRILKRLLKEPRGPSYLAKIEEDAQRLNEVIRKPILKAIKEVWKSGSFIPDAET